MSSPTCVKKMTQWGVGLRIAAMAFIAALASMAVSLVFSSFAAYPLIPGPLRSVVGFTLLAAGIPFWLTSVATVMRAYKTRRLCTSGPFALCRHPVYASWVVFILPGISLLLDSWLFLLSPLVLYAAVVKSAPEEERYLEDLFGDEYRVYQERVPMVLPLGSPGRGK